MPHALIVDDSKTARYALRLLLDKQHFTADMVESAEQALDYLVRETPDLIFMDHMMPGMDGFQAVKAIKSNTSTAQIPIVMYTSTQGGVYFGQARALGAADVISKPASAEDLAAVLQRLEDHQQLGARKSQTPASPDLRLYPQTETYDNEPPSAPPVPPSPPAAAAPLAAPEPQEPARWPNWLTGIGLVASLTLGGLLLNTINQRDQIDKQRQLAFKTVEWAINQAQEYPYGEPPFGGDRLPLLQELVQQLNASGFRGTVRLESHAGEFCLIHVPLPDGAGATWTVAPPELRLTDCNALGQSTQQSVTLSAAESSAFKRFMSELPAGIRIDTVPLGSAEPKWDYPTDPNVSAGEWNRIAQHNQRVQIILQPNPAL
jgi:CheY-like chemotaxis protein